MPLIKYSWIYRSRFDLSIDVWPDMKNSIPKMLGCLNHLDIGNMWCIMYLFTLQCVPMVRPISFDVSWLDLSIDVWYDVKNIVYQLIEFIEPFGYRRCLMCHLLVHSTICAIDKIHLSRYIPIISFDWCMITYQRHHSLNARMSKTIWIQVICDVSCTNSHYNVCQRWNLSHSMYLD